MLRNRENTGYPSLVFDANGLQHKFVKECDDETGRIVQLDVVVQDGVATYTIDPETKQVCEIISVVPAPLLIVKCDGGSSFKSRFKLKGCTCTKGHDPKCPMFSHVRHTDPSQEWERDVPTRLKNKDNWHVTPENQ